MRIRRYALSWPGNLSFNQVEQILSQALLAQRREHSRKPDEFYARVERYCTGPYIELFSRQRRPGWTAWGDELDKFEPEYDAQDDFAKSLEEGYRAIRKYIAAGGPKWVPK